MFERIEGDVNLLDPGAGAGALTKAFVEEACSRPLRCNSIRATAVELDRDNLPALEAAMKTCGEKMARIGTPFSGECVLADFVEIGSEAVAHEFLSTLRASYTHAIINPPYRKISADSAARRALSRAGIETSNLYAGFLYLAAELLVDGGELVAITPRSFCNGPYFRPFREFLQRQMRFTSLHVFDARDVVFGGDDVLQETVVFAMRKGRAADVVKVSSSVGPLDAGVNARTVPHALIVDPDDPNLFIRIPAGVVAEQEGGSGTTTLADLGLRVSTGRVVDFRARAYLRGELVAGAVPLLYPGHLKEGGIRWPRVGSKKPNAIMDCSETAALLVPRNWYVLVNRFSSKEEKRRIRASVLSPVDLPFDRIGFENHLNYFHGPGMDEVLAKGLCRFLNSSLVDREFREFNGHTQVNATDLRSLRYPSEADLRRLASSPCPVHEHAGA